MKLAPDIRETRKAAHLARVKAKMEDPENYVALYASQPSEIRKADEQGRQRRAIADAQRAIEVALGLDAHKAVEVFSGGQIAATVGIATAASAEGSTK